MTFTEFIYWAYNNKREYKRLYAQNYRYWYYPRHRRECIEYAKYYQKKYPEQASLYRKRWCEKNPEKVKLLQREANKRKYMKDKEILNLYTSIREYGKRNGYL